VNPAQIRKDLAYFGEFGVRGVGYFVAELLGSIKKILGLNKPWNLAIVGMGNLGCALVAHENFARQGYWFVAAIDRDPAKIGVEITPGLLISPLEDLEAVCKLKKVEIGVIAVPSFAAQEVANRFISASIRGILNFAPAPIHVPEGCAVENVDFTVKLDSLAYFLTQHRESAAL
jgi:redox-sensing transcriptional repressor